MAALMRGDKPKGAPERAVAKKKPTPSHPSPIGAPPGKEKDKVAKPHKRARMDEANRKKSDKEWYQDALFENLVEKWSK